MMEFESNQYEEEFGEADVIFSLAADLEEIANRYEQSYAEGESSLFKLSKVLEDSAGLI